LVFIINTNSIRCGEATFCFAPLFPLPCSVFCFKFIRFGLPFKKVINNYPFRFAAFALPCFPLVFVLFFQPPSDKRLKAVGVWCFCGVFWLFGLRFWSWFLVRLVLGWFIGFLGCFYGFLWRFCRFVGGSFSGGSAVFNWLYFSGSGRYCGWSVLSGLFGLFLAVFGSVYKVLGLLKWLVFRFSF
jgi:hypothetical protein